jgi:hypothetical protein
MTMTAPTTATTPYRPAPARPGDDRFVPLAADLGARFAERAAEHDRVGGEVAVPCHPQSAIAGLNPS